MSSLQRAKYRVVVCTGEYCNLGKRGDRLHKKLQTLIAVLNEGHDPAPVKLVAARCLNMCAVGPNVVVYPQDVAYNKVEESQLAAILAEQITEIGEEV